MSQAEFYGWAVGAAYVAAFFILTGLAMLRSGTPIWILGKPGQTLRALGFRLGFVILVLWPLIGSGWSQSLIWPSLAAIAALFALGSQLYMGRSWRVGTAAGAVGSLVTTGPFAWSRNPVFVAQVLLFWLSVPFGGWLMLAAAVMATVSAIAQVRLEEVVMQDVDGWPAYARRVPRWLGPV